MNEIIFTKQLGNSLKYDICKSPELRDGLIVTAVMGIINHPEGGIYITRNQRGWDLPGGHIDEGESTMQALYREFEEEAGSKITNEPSLWGYKYFQSTQPIPDGRGGFYPQESGIPFFRGTSTGEIFTPYGHEVEESRIVTLEEAMKMISDEGDKKILEDILQSTK